MACFAWLAIGGALLAGCGGGGGSSTTSAMGKAEFVAAADAICERADKRIEAAAGKLLGPGEPTGQQFEKFATAAVVPYTQQIIDGIEELTPPSEPGRHRLRNDRRGAVGRTTG